MPRLRNHRVDLLVICPKNKPENIRISKEPAVNLLVRKSEKTDTSDKKFTNR